MPKRRSFVRDSATGKAVQTKKLAPNLVSLEEAKRLLAEARTPEGRLALAKPFPLPEFDVMVAPAIGMDIYQTLFGEGDAVYQGDLDIEDVKKKVDRTFIKAFIKNCVIMPELDDEFLDELEKTHWPEFQLLMAFCQKMSMEVPTRRVSERMGQLDTEVQEAFFAALAGSTSTPTLA